MTTIDTERSTRGRRAFAEVMTFAAPEDTTPCDTALIDFVFAEVWERPGLSRRDRRFVTLPCVAAADAEGPLRDHVYAALNSGDVTITEMRETVLHFAVYSGWPKASRFNMVVDEQWERIHRERGQDSAAAGSAAAAGHPERPGGPTGHGEQAFRDVNCVPYVPDPRQPVLRRRHPQLRLRRDVAAARTGDEGTTTGDRGVRGVSGRAVPDPEPRLRRVEEPRHLVRRNGRTGTAFRGLLRLARRRRTSTTRSARQKQRVLDEWRTEEGAPQ